MKTNRIKRSDVDFQKKFKDFLGEKRENATDVNDLVASVLADVRQNGDKALFAYTKKFDRFDLTPETVRFSQKEIDDAEKACSPKVIEALKLAEKRIRDFHAKQKPQDALFTDSEGVTAGWRWLPVDSAGLYVPGGTAAYPSSVLMNAVPAKVAGVERLVMVVPTPDGVVNNVVLAAAKIAGVDEIYRVGGAQAIGALAYGTESISPVDMIVGPGNAYVAAAKRQVFGTVGIDMIAGPSEILVIADKKANPVWLAADLLSQAEHDTAAQSILITDSEELADAVDEQINKQLQLLSRKEIAEKSREDHAVFFLVDDLRRDAPEIANAIAPEHLEVCLDDAVEWVPLLKNAGALFLGAYTPEAVGDYVGGPNHVLPTARSARFSSGLGVHSFMKRSTVLSCSQTAVQKIGHEAVVLAQAEGLTAHGQSVSFRLEEESLPMETK